MLKEVRVKVQTAIDKLIPLQPSPSSYPMSIPASDGTVLYDAFTVIHALLLYADYDLLCYDYNNDDDYVLFGGRWDHYLRMHVEDLQRLYEAAYAVYNPIENYNMQESSTDGRKEDKTTKETTPSGTTQLETTHTGSETTTDTYYKAGLDSTGDGVQTDKITSQRDPALLTDTVTTSYTDAKTTDTTTPDNTIAGTFDGQTVGSYHDVQEHYMKRAGNIGSMSTQTMILQEWSIREKTMLMEFIQGFIDMFGMFVGGC